MKTNQVYSLKLLGNIFFPDANQGVRHIVVHDHLEVMDDKNKLIGRIDFKTNQISDTLHSYHFDYVNNQDGSIRWIYPAELKSPVFLQLYNGSGWRGFLFKTVFQLAFLLGLKKWIKSGSLQIDCLEKLSLQKLMGEQHIHNWAVFTGTVGDNRKAVAVLKNQRGAACFYKIPLTKSAIDLVQKEWSVLNNLNQFSFKKMTIPQAQFIDGGVLQSDIKPTYFKNTHEMETIHYDALKEIKEQTIENVLLKKMPLWAETEQYLLEINRQEILNDLSRKTVDSLINKLMILKDTFDPYLMVPTTMAHGDFTPWNMYVGEDKLHVYDWELSERLPMLFDAFHFIFQSGVLIKRQSGNEINTKIQELKNNDQVKDLLSGYIFGFDGLFHLYLLKNISYYLLKYMRQDPLHEQAHWLLKAWDGILTEVIINYETQPVSLFSRLS